MGNDGIEEERLVWMGLKELGFSIGVGLFLVTCFVSSLDGHGWIFMWLW